MRIRHLIYGFLIAVALTAAPPFYAAGQQIGISASEARRQARLFDRHTVRMGETAFSIARGYAISPLTLAQDNPGLDLTRLRAGQDLLIRKRERGKTDPAQVAREWQRMVERKTTAATEETTADGTPPVPQQTGEPHADSLWSALGDLNGEGIYHRPEVFSGRRGLRDFTPGGGDIPRIAVMLPLSGAGVNPAGNDFTDFWKGSLLALENLKAQGRSAKVTLYDSGRSAYRMQSIVSSADFVDTDLIIGPVYEDELEPAVQFGEFFGVPVVSPLAALRNLDSDVLYQMAPDAGSKFDKLRGLWEGDANVILVSSGAGDDVEFEREMTAELGARSYGRFTIGQGDIATLIDWERPNVLVVLAGSELTVDKALASISSSYNNSSARRGRKADITVVGSSRWANYGTTIDETLLFKLGVKFVANYYIDRSDRESRLFEARYLEVYGDFPSRAAFRGYDAVALFAGALFESGLSMDDRLERVGPTPLATPYRFVQRGGGELRHINDQWTLISFTSDYNIIIQ